MTAEDAIRSALLRVARNVAKHFVERPGHWSEGDECFNIDLRESERELAAAVRNAERAALERAARLCVRRSVSWSRYDDDQPAEYRRGVEEAASQLAAAIRALSPPSDGDGTLAWRKDPPDTVGPYW